MPAMSIEAGRELQIKGRQMAFSSEAYVSLEQAHKGTPQFSYVTPERLLLELAKRAGLFGSEDVTFFIREKMADYVDAASTRKPDYLHPAEYSTTTLHIIEIAEQLAKGMPIEPKHLAFGILAQEMDVNSYAKLLLEEAENGVVAQHIRELASAA